MQDQVQPTPKVRQIVSGPNHRTYYDPRKMAELEEGLAAAGRAEARLDASVPIGPRHPRLFPIHRQERPVSRAWKLKMAI
jgi:hypothetical protein